MELNSNLLNEVIADAKAIRETAIATASARLKDSFEPTVRQLISQRLAETDDEETTEEPVVEPEAPVEDEAPVVEPEFAPEEDPVDDMEDEDDVTLEAILAELDAETEEEPVMEPAPEEEEEITEEMLDRMIAEMEGEMTDEPEEEEPMAESRRNRRTPRINESNVVRENKNLKRQLTEAKRQLKEAYVAITTQKETINEVNLLNSKLLYLTKITNSPKYKLSAKQQVAILEAFDRANTVREVKLVYATICESLGKATPSAAKPASKVAGIMESASKPTRAVKGNLNEEYAFAARWKSLAGIV